MDRKLAPENFGPVGLPAQKLLTLSPTYESDLETQRKSPYTALEALSPLAELTRKSIQALLQQKQLVTQAKAPAPRPALSQKTTPPAGNLTEVLKTLQNLRSSGQSFRRTPPHCTPILKAPPK